MTDPIIVHATANILFQGFSVDARETAARLASENLAAGDLDRARMWEDVVTVIGEMIEADRFH